MNYPMRSDLNAGNKFPDFELPDQANTKRKLSVILGGFPGVLTFVRGHF